MEKVLHGLLLRAVSIDEVFACAAEHNLTCNGDLTIFFKANWRFLLVAVVEDDCYAGLGHAGLAAFIDQVLGT